MTYEQQALSLRALHAPVVEDDAVVCAASCTYGPDSDRASWPCLSADVLYSSAEHLDLAQPLLAQIEQHKEMARQKRIARQAELDAGAMRTTSEVIRDIYEPHLKAMIVADAKLWSREGIWRRVEDVDVRGDGL